VTAETRNQLVAVDLRTGRVLRRLPEPSDPENVVMGPIPIVVSSASHTVSLLNSRDLRPFAVLRRFASPHIATFATGGRFAYVSDDGAGTVTPIDLRAGTELAAVAVGAGAHHMAASPDGRRLWVALGESARTIVVLDTSDRAHPRVLQRFDPGFVAHDLVFSPDGRSVWISSASGPEVTVFDSGTRRMRFRVAVGPPPQHIAFARSSVYLTSGYGSRVERVAAASGRLLARAVSPYGSFELDAAYGYVVVSSLLRGTLAIYDLKLARERTLTLAPATRDVAIMSG
jgi:DNA-binding beta-propeller fold protein YncE